MADDRYDKVTLRGVTLDKYTRAALLAAERDLGFELHIYQGSYHTGVSASAGTHDGGGAIDVSPKSATKVVKALRRHGFAAWVREAIPGKWVKHIHAVQIGNAKLASLAAQQVEAYRDGYDGLGYIGRGGRDTGWRPAKIEPFDYRTHLDVKLMTLNAASPHPGWVRPRGKGRVGILARQIKAIEPDLLFGQEMYTRRRRLLTLKIRSVLRGIAAHNGRALYRDPKAFKLVKGSITRIKLPHGKYAVAATIEHIETGKRINVVSAHLSWEKGAAAEEKRADEVRSLVSQVKKRYPKYHTIYGGDWNASAKDADSVGKTFAELGYHDAYKDVTAGGRHNELHNSANQYEPTAHKSGRQLDRFFIGKDVEGISWRLDYYAPPLGSDHYGVVATIRIEL